jgi:hypothetical protein
MPWLRPETVGPTGETMKRFVPKPSDRAAVVQQLAESAGEESSDLTAIAERARGIAYQPPGA